VNPRPIYLTGVVICDGVSQLYLYTDLEEFNVLLTVHQLNQRDALFIQFIKNSGPLRVSSNTCSSSGGGAQAALGILQACYVSWLHQVHPNPGAAN
jgi:predicted outer membrane repeat protein